MEALKVLKKLQRPRHRGVISGKENEMIIEDYNGFILKSVDEIQNNTSLRLEGFFEISLEELILDSELGPGNALHMALSFLKDKDSEPWFSVRGGLQRESDSLREISLERLSNELEKTSFNPTFELCNLLRSNYDLSDHQFLFSNPIFRCIYILFNKKCTLSVDYLDTIIELIGGQRETGVTEEIIFTLRFGKVTLLEFICPWEKAKSLFGNEEF